MPRSVGSRSTARHESSKISATKMFLHFETIITICSCRPGGRLGVAEAVPQSLRPYEFSALSHLLMRDLLYRILFLHFISFFTFLRFYFLVFISFFKKTSFLGNYFFDFISFLKKFSFLYVNYFVISFFSKYHFLGNISF